MTAIGLAMATVIVTLLFSFFPLKFRISKFFLLTGLILPALTFLYCYVMIEKYGPGEGYGDAYFAWFMSLPIQFLISIVIAFSVRALVNLIRQG